MRKIFSLSIVVLFFVSAASLKAQYLFDIDPNAGGSNNYPPQDVLWDVQFNYDCAAVTGANGNAGAVYIPTLNEFWTSRWASNIIHRWNSNGTLIEQFTITNVTGVRSFTFDGTFVYAGINTTAIQIIDPVTRTRVGTITAPQTVRYVTYDPTADGGNGGLWLGNFSTNLQLISMTGTVLVTHTYGSLGVTSIYGAAWDGLSVGGPFLWLWGQGAGAGSPQWIVQINPATGLPTGVMHDVITDVGVGQTGAIAGGLFVAFGLVPNQGTLGGLLQGVPDRLFGYDLGNVIPVELTSFTASVSNNDVVLNWSTASEINNHGFEVQKMMNNEFYAIGFVEGSGTTTNEKSYSFYDRNVSSGKLSYRLKQIDFNGAFEYSPIVEVEVAVPVAYTLGQNYPNPFNPSTTITFGLSVDSKVSLKVFDMLGQEIAVLVDGSLTAGNHEINFDASSLNSGVYFYTLEANGIDGISFMNTKKMILTK
jgi:hypothetical protein